MILYLQFIFGEGEILSRFRRGLCIFMAALISFSLIAELAPVVSDASSLTEEITDEAADLGEEVDLVEAKKTTKKATPTPIPYENPEGAELTYRAYMHGSGWDKEYTEQG